MLALIVRQGMVPVVVGLAAGVAVALFLGYAIRGLLFGVLPADPLTIAAVTVMLLVVAALACVDELQSSLSACSPCLPMCRSMPKRPLHPITAMLPIS